MSAVKAALVQADDARAFLARKVEQAGDEVTRQAWRIRAGMPYDGQAVAVRMEAIDEARQILDALDTNVARLLKAGSA